MFEPAPAPRSRPMLAVSGAAHAALAAFLVVPPLFATPEAPELDGYVKIEHIPVLTSDPPIRPVEDSLRKGRGGSPPVRSAGASDTGMRSRLEQPHAIGNVLPPATGEEPQLPFEEWGERSESSRPGSGRGNGAAEGEGSGCEGCSILSASAPGVTPPVPLETVSPAYPELARRAHLEGVVVLEAIIGADGSVRDVRVVRSVHPLLDPAALEAVRRWRYRAATIGTRPVAVFLNVVVTFSLR